MGVLAAGGEAPVLFRSALLPSEQQISGHEQREDHGDHSVHSEKCSVKFAKIIAFDQRMLIQEQQHDRYNSGQCKSSQPKGWDQSYEKAEHDEMENPRNPKSRANADVSGDRVQPRVAVKLEVLARIENIESRNPESHSGGKQQDARIERASNRNPCGGRRDTKSEAEHQMRKAREPLGIRVEQQDSQCDRRQPESESIQL